MSEDDFVIRPLTRDDLPAVWTIEQQLTGPWTYGQLAEELAVPHGWRFVICPSPAHDLGGDNEHQPGQPPPASLRPPVLGYIFGTTIIDEAEIRKIAVAPEHRRQGIATRLLAAVDQFLVASAVRECFLELRAANDIALALYQKNGFRIVGRRKNYYTLPTDDAILVKKCLNLPS